jgi:predicted transposase/invertase (TIGR01784 family)
MQMEWSTAFPSRMLYNTSKAYVRQLKSGENYAKLHPVYGLGILTETFDHKTKEFYHHYRMLNSKNLDEAVKGIELVLVELPKFTPTAWTTADKRMAVLWLRFLQEVKDMGDHSLQLPDDLLKDEDVRKALDICEEGKFTPEELDAYEREWMRISNEVAMLGASYEEGEKKGKQEGKQEGIEIGKTEAEAEAKIKAEAEAKIKVEAEVKAHMCATAKKLKATDMPVDQISEITGLSVEEIERL